MERQAAKKIFEEERTKTIRRVTEMLAGRTPFVIVNGIILGVKTAVVDEVVRSRLAAGAENGCCAAWFRDLNVVAAAIAALGEGSSVFGVTDAWVLGVASMFDETGVPIEYEAGDGPTCVVANILSENRLGDALAMHNVVFADFVTFCPTHLMKVSIAPKLNAGSIDDRKATNWEGGRLNNFGRLLVVLCRFMLPGCILYLPQYFGPEETRHQMENSVMKALLKQRPEITAMPFGDAFAQPDHQGTVASLVATGWERLPW